MPDYSEMDGYPQEQLGENGHFYAERRLKCLWADRYDVLKEVGGFGGEIYPYWPESGALATGGGIIPFAAMKSPAGVAFPSEANYEHAIVIVKYTTYALVKLGSKWVTEELQPSQKLLNVDTSGMTWQNDGTDVEPADSITKLLTAFDYVVTYFQLGGIPSAAYAEVGKINSAPVGSLLLGLTFSAKTLLHTRPVVTRTFDPGTLMRFRLTYRFSFHPKTWNHFWNVSKWSRLLKADSTEADIYESFNFLDLVP